MSQKISAGLWSLTLASASNRPRPAPPRAPWAGDFGAAADRVAVVDDRTLTPEASWQEPGQCFNGFLGWRRCEHRRVRAGARHHQICTISSLLARPAFGAGSSSSDVSHAVPAAMPAPDRLPPRRRSSRISDTSRFALVRSRVARQSLHGWRCRHRILEEPKSA